MPENWSVMPSACSSNFHSCDRNWGPWSMAMVSGFPVYFDTQVFMNASQIAAVDSCSKNVAALNFESSSTKCKTVFPRMDIGSRHTVRMKKRSSSGSDNWKQSGASDSRSHTSQVSFIFSRSARTLGDTSSGLARFSSAYDFVDVGWWKWRWIFVAPAWYILFLIPIVCIRGPFSVSAERSSHLSLISSHPFRSRAQRGFREEDLVRTAVAHQYVKRRLRSTEMVLRYWHADLDRPNASFLALSKAECIINRF